MGFYAKLGTNYKLGNQNRLLGFDVIFGAVKNKLSFLGSARKVFTTKVKNIFNREVR